jgi:hypothetical protein
MKEQRERGTEKKGKEMGVGQKAKFSELKEGIE